MAEAEPDWVLEDGRQTERTLELFISVLGHDLRDPLAAVMAAAGLLLQRGELSEAQHRNVQRIKASSERMARMIADVLDFARTRARRMEIHPAPTNLHDLCRQMVDEHRTAHPEREIQLVLAGEPRGLWDADRLAQVVSNLLSNAESYSADGKPICICVEDAPSGVQLTVRNDGPTIPPEKLDTLFDPFRRGDLLERRTNAHGLGLGLYIVKSIVDAHGGRIEVRSSSDEGTTFTVWLPRRPAEASAGAAAESAH